MNFAFPLRFEIVILKGVSEYSVLEYIAIFQNTILHEITAFFSHLANSFCHRESALNALFMISIYVSSYCNLYYVRTWEK